MKITLTKISHNERLSEETHCFDATVKINGNPAFGVCNHGHGGNNEYYDLHSGSYTAISDLVKQAEDWVRINCPSHETLIENKDGTFWRMPMSLDCFICDLVNDYLDKKNLTRMLRTSWVFANKDGVFSFRKTAHPDQVERESKTSILLNNLSRESALETYKQYCHKA